MTPDIVWTYRAVLSFNAIFEHERQTGSCIINGVDEWLRACSIAYDCKDGNWGGTEGVEVDGLVVLFTSLADALAFRLMCADVAVEITNIAE